MKLQKGVREYNIFQTYLTREPFFFFFFLAEEMFIEILQNIVFGGAQFWEGNKALSQRNGLKWRNSR